MTDIARRLSIIVCGAWLFGKTLTRLNKIGTALALAGVLAYSLLNRRLQQARQKKA